MFSKRAILSVIDLPSFFALICDDLDGAGGVYGYEASRRGNGVLAVCW